MRYKDGRCASNGTCLFASNGASVHALTTRQAYPGMVLVHIAPVLYKQRRLKKKNQMMEQQLLVRRCTATLVEGDRVINVFSIWLNIQNS